MEKGTFIWEEKYSVAVQLFDEQHKVFFQIANNVLDFMHSEMAEPRKRGVLISLLKDLQNYGIYHLNSEEEYFNQFHYEDAVPHIAAHNNFRDVMERFMRDAGQKDADVKKIGKEMAEFAGNWLLKHIFVMDKGYAKFFHKLGI